MAEHRPTSELPITFDVDVCVTGGTLAGVAAAAAAAAAGRSVLLLAAPPYLGEDCTATFRSPGDDEDLPAGSDGELARALFAGPDGRRPTPMHAKTACEDHLIDAGVRFLYGCYPVAVLRRDDDVIAGVVVASRSGRFVVRAGAVIDATTRATTARLAGVGFQSYPAGEQLFEQVVIGGEARGDDPAIEAVQTDAEAIRITGRRDQVRTFPVHRYQLRIPMKDGGPDAFAAAEQRAHLATFHPAQERTGDQLWQLPPDPMLAGTHHLSAGDPLRDPARFTHAARNLWIAGPCADCSRSVAAELVQPLTACRFGAALGAAVARDAVAEASGSLRVGHVDDEAITAGELRSQQDDVRLYADETVPVDTRRAPVLVSVDVLVLGGGTGGAAAGISAARHGAETLIVEYQPQLGGVGTVGMIANYYHGNRVGFTSEIDRGVAAMGPEELMRKRDSLHHWKIEWKQQWYRQAAQAAGARVWTHAIGYGVLVDGDTVRGVLVATPHGVGLVYAKAVVDGSGNADVPAHAGAATERIGGEHVGIQGAGLGPRQLGQEYRNTDWTFADCDDVIDTTAAMVVARRKFAGEFDLSTLVDTRERRRIIGEVQLGPLDFLGRRTWADTLVQANSNFDSHGFTVHPIFQVEPPNKDPLEADVPFRCLLPKGLRGVAVTGLGKSAHRDALPVVRMQPDVQNEGYAVGMIAARAAAAGCDMRDIDLRPVQQHLVTIGNLTEAVPAHTDSPAPSDAQLEQAIHAGCPDHHALAMVFGHRERALPILRRHHVRATDADQRLRLAQILGLLGDAHGAATLAAAIGASDWDDGWNFKGMGQFGRSASPVDDLLMALARSGAGEHAGVVVAKAAALRRDHDMSHSRALAEAVERLRITAATPHLVRVLGEEGVRGHHHHDARAAAARTPANHIDTTTRNDSLREIHLARALYRVGDVDGIGTAILQAYARDLRGPYARHARAVLEEGAPIVRQESIVC